MNSLGSWLYLVAGLSRSSVNCTMKVINAIVALAVEFGEISARLRAASKSKNLWRLPSLPLDVRTAMKELSTEPTLVQTICCPRCFKQYPLGHIPTQCDYCATARSRVCGAELWTTRATRSGPVVVPQRLYSVQDFESWLKYFLSCPGIEDKIDKLYTHIPNT